MLSQCGSAPKLEVSAGQQRAVGWRTVVGEAGMDVEEEEKENSFAFFEKHIYPSLLCCCGLKYA